jgi:hypothetical protein
MIELGTSKELKKDVEKFIKDKANLTKKQNYTKYYYENCGLPDDIKIVEDAEKLIEKWDLEIEKWDLVNEISYEIAKRLNWES